MKNTIKLLGIVTLVAAAGLLAVNCLTVTPTNTSIDGVWDRGGDIVITISGDIAVFTQFNPNYRHIEAVNIGITNIGDQCIRNIQRTGYYSFTGELLWVLFDRDSSGAIIRYTGKEWRNCTITVSRDGTIMMVDDVDKYTRVQ